MTTIDLPSPALYAAGDTEARVTFGATTDGAGLSACEHRRPTIGAVGYCLGIDLGTTYTSAALVRDGRAETVPLGNRAPVIPSVVFLRDDEQVLTGEAANRRGVTEPGRVAREFKRRLGDPTPIIVGGSPYSADALMAKLLRWVVDIVTEQQGGAPDAIVVSHPANWGPYKTDLLDQAITRAGLEGVFTITEPEAAAFHYASQERVDQGAIIAVFDLGGGTFDAAVLRKNEDAFEVLGEPQGIERLGGVDFDEAVFQFVLAALGDAIGELDPDDSSTLAAVARLRQECVDAKEALSSDTEVSIPVLLPNLQTEVRLTRAEFEGLVRPALGDAITALERALRSAGVDAGGVTTVLLVGGSSRIPLVAQMVGSAIGRPVAADAHPKHGVALGAALHAARRLADTSDSVSSSDPGLEQISPTIPAMAPTVSTPAVPPELPVQPTATEPHGSSASSRSLGKPLFIGLGVVALLVAVGGAAMLLGDEDDEAPESGADIAAVTTLREVDVSTGGPEATAAPRTNPVTATAEVSTTSSIPTGPFVRLTDVSIQDGTYLATYEVTGYVPQVDGGPDSLHIHLYLNDIDPENAGTTGPLPGTWDITDAPTSFRTSVSPADAAARGATQMCALVATVTHGVFDPDSGTCLDLPA